MSPVVYNATPYCQQNLLMADPAGQLAYVVIVSATYEFDDRGEPFLAGAQAPIAVADEPRGGPPGRVSIRRDSMALLGKPKVDLLIEASAHAPFGRQTGQALVGVRIGDWSKALVVTGDRRWTGPLRSRPSAPRPYLRMPLCYERAYGGSVKGTDGEWRAWHAENPVGVGLAGALPADPAIETLLPNIERPDDRLRGPGRCAVAGFGVVARHWQPRVAHAGTYDARWLADRSPLLPTDFKAEFHQCAPTDQQFATDLRGEPVVLRNLTPEGDWRFRMPGLDVDLTLIAERFEDRRSVGVDTIEIDADARQVTLVGRCCIGGLRTLGSVRELVLGRPSPAWRRARLTGKRHMGRSPDLAGS